MAKLVLHLFFHPPLAPEKPPKNIRAKRLNDTAISVKWSPLSMEEARGVVVKYTIYYQEAEESMEPAVQVSSQCAMLCLCWLVSSFQVLINIYIYIYI